MRNKHNRRFALVVGLCVWAIFATGCQVPPAPPPAPQPPTFAVLTDIQYADKDSRGARHYRTALARLEDCVSDLDRRRPDFVIHLGDIVDGHANDVPRTIADQETVLRVLARLKAPVYHVIGNHCLTLGQERLRQSYRLERFYYDFTVPSAKGWRFVVLDGNDAGYGVVGAGPR